MTSPTALVLVAALASGGVAALGTAVLLAPEAPPAEASAAPTQQAVESLRREIQRLSDQQGELARQIQSVELQLVSASGTTSSQPEPIVASQQELTQLREQVATLSARVGDVPVEGPVMIQTVSAALEQIREQEDAKRQREREEAQAARRAERLDELAQQLGLDTYQRGRMENVLIDGETRRDAILASARDTGEFGGMRDAFEALGRETQESLATFLSPSQLEALEGLGGVRALGGTPRWGGFGGRGGDFGGGRGGAAPPNNP